MSGAERADAPKPKLTGNDKPAGGSWADQILGKPTEKPADKPAEKPAGEKPADKPAEKPAEKPAGVTDKPVNILQLDYKDIKPGNNNFDDLIWKTKVYDTLEIKNLPPGVGIQHWKDDKGYYFWFKAQNGDELSRHYYPGNVSWMRLTGSPSDQNQNVNEQRKKINEAILKKDGINVIDGVLTLSLNDPNLDAKIKKTNLYDTLKITDVPPGTKTEYFMDGTGYYFEIGGKKHYYPTNAKQLVLNSDAPVDLTKTRTENIEDFANKYLGGFQSMTRTKDSQSNMKQVMDYANGMGKVAGGATDVLKARLEEACKTSNVHPYYKIYLATLTAAEIIPDIQKLALAGKSLNDPILTDKLDKAIEILGTVKDESNGRLRKINKYPMANAPLMPLDSRSVYRNDPNGFYYFWGGSYDQAGHLKIQLELWRDLLKADVFQIPPAQPPGRRRP